MPPHRCATASGQQPTQTMSTTPNPPGKDALTLRAILRSAPTGIILMDARGRITDANPAAERLFGRSEGEMMGEPVTILMPEPDHSAHDRYVRNYLTSGEKRIIGIDREVKARRADGTIFPIHLAVGELELDGEHYFTGIITDLSALKAAESRRRESEALFASIFESQPDAILVTDPERRVRIANNAFETTFGISRETLAGRTTVAFYESEDEWRRQGELGFGVDSEPEHRAHILRFRRANGEIFPGSTVRSVIRDSSGRFLGFVEVIRDISADVRREAQLLQAQRMEAIGQLTGGIAHDFNNLLTVILGNLELLEPHLEGDLQLSLASEALEASEMGARLTDRLLTFGRRQHLETRQINLNEFVLASTDILRRTIGEDIDLSTALAGDLWLTDADPAQIENAVLNLAINARDAMPKGGRIVIETRNAVLDTEAVAMIPELPPGSYVVLSVADSGSGMTPDVKARAFEPFFTTKGPGRGNGLGLATIYGFCKQSGGLATIYSEVDQGTVVNLYLPAAENQDNRGETLEATDIVAAPGKGEIILVVEDDERVRRLTRTRLEQLGYIVLEARSGSSALDMLRNGTRCHLVFTDIVMPGGLSGLELQRLVNREFPGISVVLTSGYAKEFVDAEGYGLETVWLLRKPYRQAELADMIAAVLAHRED